MCAGKGQPEVSGDHRARRRSRPLRRGAPGAVQPLPGSTDSLDPDLAQVWFWFASTFVLEGLLCALFFQWGERGRFLSRDLCAV